MAFNGRSGGFGLGDGFAAGGFEFAAAEDLFALIQVLLLVLDGRRQAFKRSFALGERLLSGGECLLFGGGLRVLCLFQGGAFVVDAGAFSFNGIALTGKLLVGELAFELLFLFNGFTVQAFQLREFLVCGGIGFIASRECEDGWQHD